MKRWTQHMWICVGLKERHFVVSGREKAHELQTNPHYFISFLKDLKCHISHYLSVFPFTSISVCLFRVHYYQWTHTAAGRRLPNCGFPRPSFPTLDLMTELNSPVRLKLSKLRSSSHSIATLKLDVSRFCGYYRWISPKVIMVERFDLDCCITFTQLNRHSEGPRPPFSGLDPLNNHGKKKGMEIRLLICCLLVCHFVSRMVFLQYYTCIVKSHKTADSPTVN